MQASTLFLKSDQYIRFAKYATTKCRRNFVLIIMYHPSMVSFNTPGDVVIPTVLYRLFGLQSESIPVQVFVQRFLFSPLGTRDSSECKIKYSGSLERHQ